MGDGCKGGTEESCPSWPLSSFPSGCQTVSDVSPSLREYHPQLEGCSQNTKYAVDYSKSSKQLIILFLLLWCNTMNIVLIGCMSCFAEQCTLPGGTGEIKQKVPGGWVGLPSGTHFPCLIKTSYSIQQAIMETLMKWV